MIIKGGYWEHILRSGEGKVAGSTRVWRGLVPIRFRNADDLHWLELEKDENGNEISCWSLFLMGKKRKEWGFVDFVKHRVIRS